MFTVYTGDVARRRALMELSKEELVDIVIAYYHDDKEHEEMWAHDADVQWERKFGKSSAS